MAGKTSLIKSMTKLSKNAAEELRRKIARDKAIKKANKDKKPTQKDLKFSKRKDIRMPETSPKSADIRTVTGTKGVTARGEVINVGDDVLGFSNFLKMQQSKSGLSRAKYKEKLNQITRSKTATKEQKEKAQSKRNAMEAADKTATRKQTGGQRGKSTKTIAKSDDPFFRALEEAKEDGVLGKDYEKLLPNQKKQIEQAAKAFQKSEFRKEVEAKIAEPKSAPKSVGSAVENKRRIGINDYRKGGYVLSSVDNRKNKGK